MSERKLPITRVNKFYSEEDFDLDIEMGREHFEGDGNFVVVLYRVESSLSHVDDLYNEPIKDGIRFKTPVELLVIPKLETPENKTYNTSSGSLRYLEDGKLSFIVYEKQLVELDVDITYGDYIGYPINETEMRFFSVTNDGIKFFDHKHTIIGYKGAYRSITCAPVDKTEFNSM